MYTIDDIHRVNDMLLAEVDRICRKNEIQYFIDSGTLIGAVRHHGNIPWDDDVDIAMPRKEYERFMKIASQELGEDFDLVVPKDYGERSFFDFITHIVYNKSTVKPETGEMAFLNNKLNHIVLDIFILDDITENVFLQKMKILKLKVIYGLSWSHRYKLDYSEYSTLQKIGVFALSTVGKLFKQTTLEKWYSNCSKSDNGKGYNKCFASNYPFEFIQYVFDKDTFASGVDMDYEGHKFIAPVGFDKNLRLLYGDYMQFPPVEKQKAEHYDINSEYLKITF